MDVEVGMMLAAAILHGLILAGGGPGFTSLVAPSTPFFPRNSEGSVIELKNGSILLAWSRFTGGAADAAAAEIAGMLSRDGGRTWGEPFVVQKNNGRQNVMSASLLRLRSGKIGLFYLVKNSDTDLHLYSRYSADEAKSWGPPARVTMDPGYNIVNNDRVVQLSSGRLIVPVSFSPDIGKPTPIVSFVLYSDDDGRTWRKSASTLTAPKRGAMEPGVVELADGRLLMIIRTQTGRIYRSFSQDKGETWTEAKETEVVSPESPASIARIAGGNDLLLIWNSKYVSASGHGGPRTPLTAAISHDDGETWRHAKNIEDDSGRQFAYTSIAFVGDRVLLTYYDSTDWGKGLSLRFRSVPIKWVYGQ